MQCSPETAAGLDAVPIEHASNKHAERVCFPRKTGPTPAKVQDGQIGPGTSFGVALMEIVARTDVRRVLEIGTW